MTASPSPAAMPEPTPRHVKRQRPLWVWFVVAIALALLLFPVGTLNTCSDGDTSSSCSTTYVSVVGMVTGIGYPGN
jgi:hypothetical protein